MQDFKVGQRWSSAGEISLGLGMVLEVDFRTVTLIFPGNGELRTYAKQDAPLSRVVFDQGDQISDQQGRQLEVLSVQSNDGLMVYQCRDQQSRQVSLPEGKLNSFLKLNQPLQRLLNGQLDKNQWFELRARTRKVQSLLFSSSLYGLTGCRTSLIDHQLYIAHEVAGRYAPRVLLADEVGLGKTIEAGLILHQQLLTERIRRVLIVVPESLLHQWLVEMMRRFNLLFHLFDEPRCEALQGSDDSDQMVALENPFDSEQLVLCSLDFLLKYPQRAEQVQQVQWDMLIVDEAHHLQWHKETPSEAYRLVDSLARQIDSVLLLTATPEQLGKESHFARLRLLDPDRYNSLQHFLEDEQHYRELADIVDALLSGERLAEEQQNLLQATLVEADNRQWLEQIDDEDWQRSVEAREQLVEHLLDRHGTGRVLFRNTRHAVKGFPGRELLSYPLDLPEPYQKALAVMQDDETDKVIEGLTPERLLKDDSSAVAWCEIDPRVEWLVAFGKEHRQSKTVVICHAADTAIELQNELRRRSGLQVALFHEGLSLVERDRAAAWFADMESGAQLLLCSEIGSEGRNFQFSSDLVMFDLPPDPDLLEQRIGRLDRIGQKNTIKIHVPYFIDSVQQVMLQWLDRGLQAFSRTCPAGHSVFTRMQQPLWKALCQPAQDCTTLLQQTRELHEQLDSEIQAGRDRLLEYNSCRPEKAELLKQQIGRLKLDLPAYLDQIYDCYGVSSEQKSAQSWIISPGNHMVMPIPGLMDEGMTVTYDREVALANEDQHFLSWEHPLVRTLMDMLISSEMGNTAVTAIRYQGVAPGSLLLDCFFQVEISDLPGSQGQKYLPDNLLRFCLDEQGGEHQQNLSQSVMSKIASPVPDETAVKVIKAREERIKALLELSEQRAKKSLPAKIESALGAAHALLQTEVDRLQALRKVNPNVRQQEIDFFQKSLDQANRQIREARLRLDAVRVMVAV